MVLDTKTTIKRKKNLGTPFSNSQVFVHSFWKSSWLSIIGYIYIYCYLLWLLIFVGWKGSSRALSWLLSQIVSPLPYKCLNSLGSFCFSFSFSAPLFPIWHFAFIHITDFRHRIDFSHSWTWLCPRLKTEWTKRNKKFTMVYRILKHGSSDMFVLVTRGQRLIPDQPRLSSI